MIFTWFQLNFNDFILKTHVFYIDFLMFALEIHRIHSAFAVLLNDFFAFPCNFMIFAWFHMNSHATQQMQCGCWEAAQLSLPGQGVWWVEGGAWWMTQVKGSGVRCQGSGLRGQDCAPDHTIFVRCCENLAKRLWKALNLLKSMAPGHASEIQTPHVSLGAPQGTK